MFDRRRLILHQMSRCYVVAWNLSQCSRGLLFGAKQTKSDSYMKSFKEAKQKERKKKKEIPSAIAQFRYVTSLRGSGE